jgi:hypothetical protein
VGGEAAGVVDGAAGDHEAHDDSEARAPAATVEAVRRTAEGERDPRLGGSIRSRRSRRRAPDEAPVDDRPRVVVRPRVRDEPRATDEHRPRRFEPFPRWGYVLLAVTAAVTPVAVYFGYHDNVAPGGTSCGSALFPTEFEGQAIAKPCARMIADAQPWALALGVLAVALVMTSITTLVVRAWIPREASTAD